MTVSVNMANICLLFISLFAFFDGINFLSKSGGITSLKLSSLVFVAFQITAFFMLIKSRNVTMTVQKIFTILFLLAFTSAFGFFLFQLNFYAYISPLVFLYCLDKYFFIFIAFYFLQKAFVENSNNFNRVFLLYEYLIFFNAMLALCGFIFNVEALQTYPHGKRFGFRGIFSDGTNGYSVYCLIALFYGICVYEKEKRKSPLISAILSSFLLGAKAAWGIGIVILLWFLAKYHRKCFFIFVFAGFIGVVFYGNVLLDKIISFDAINFFIELNQKGKYPIEKIIFSSRLELAEHFFSNLNYWNPLNYLFGGGGFVTFFSGLPRARIFITELDILDIPLFFGFLGTAIFIYAYILIFKNIGFEFRKFFMLCFFITAAISGHSFDTSGNAVYLVLFILKSRTGEHYVDSLA